MPSQKVARQQRRSRCEARLQDLLLPAAGGVVAAASAAEPRLPPKPIKVLGIDIDTLLKQPQRAIDAIRPLLSATQGAGRVDEELQKATATLR